MAPRAPSARSIKARAHTISARLADEYPGSARELCALQFETPFQLLAATILSAQSTDVRVNMVTPELFAAYPDPESLSGADPEAVEEIVRSTGFFRAKTKSLIGMSGAVVERFGGQVPHEMEDLVTLPGVGRKTANVLRSVAFGLPGLPVDTHVTRLTRRLGLTKETDPVKIELEVSAMVAPEELGALSLRLILHGRAVCVARRPRCPDCLLNDLCPSADLGGAAPATKVPGKK
jgi:endonuclease-3